MIFNLKKKLNLSSNYIRTPKGLKDYIRELSNYDLWDGVYFDVFVNVRNAQTRQREHLHRLNNLDDNDISH